LPPGSQPQENLLLEREPADSEGQAHFHQRKRKFSISAEVKLAQVTAYEPLRPKPDGKQASPHVGYLIDFPNAFARSGPLRKSGSPQKIAPGN
jgi:hypothetical protein